LWLTVLGGLVVTLAMYDVVVTALAVSRGPGPLSGRLSLLAWNLARRGRRSHRVMRRMGTVLLVSTLLLWIVTVMIGWTLVFCGERGAVHDDHDHPASTTSRVYFTGSALLGRVGTEYAPGGDTWQLLSLAAGANGVILAGLGIAYLIPVVGAVTSKRKLAGWISTLGVTPHQVLRTTWNGRDFGQLDLQLVGMTPDIALLGQRLLAYPLVHYFHSSERFRAAAPSIAALDESLTLLRYGVAPEARPDAVTLHAVRAAIAELLETIETNFLRAELPEPPPAPGLGVLSDAGVPVVDDAEFTHAVDQLRHRRALLRALVEHDGWTWDVVYEPDLGLHLGLDDTWDALKAPSHAGH
jgi:hypothetical protein